MENRPNTFYSHDILSTFGPELCGALLYGAIHTMDMTSASINAFANANRMYTEAPAYS